MCGIIGIISLKKRALIRQRNVDELRGMLRILSHRGPDGSGLFCQDDFALGSTRLEIIGGDEGKQPMQLGDNSFVFNGEIYNFKELQEELPKSERVVSPSDSYVFFNFLNRRGIGSLNKLNGMFAFCYVTKDKIYLARDHFGKKPLFYTTKNGLLYFASEIKAFINIVPLELKITDMYASLETEPFSNTLYSNVFQLPAGSFMEIDRATKKTKIISYYSLQSLNIKTEISLSFGQLKEKLRLLLTDAVLIRARYNKDIGVYASGGLDSSLVALIASPQYLFTFLSNSKHVPSEEKYVDDLSKKLKKSKLVKVENGEYFLRDFIDMVYLNDGPTTTFAAYAQYQLSKMANNANIRVTLSGLGADEFFNGYARHAIAVAPVNYLSGRLFKGYENLIEKASLGSGENKVDQVYYNLINRNNMKNPALKKLISKVFTSQKNVLDAVSICDSLLTLPPLLSTDDRINMAFHIENRSPFMDYRLIEFALSIPEDKRVRFEQNSSSIITKYLLKEAFKDILPKSIYNREDKVGFTSNINDLLNGEMGWFVKASSNLLRKTFPGEPYFLHRKRALGKYDRWDYQIVQIATAYLLFTKKYSQERVYEYFMGQRSN